MSDESFLGQSQAILCQSICEIEGYQEVLFGWEKKDTYHYPLSFIIPHPTFVIITVSPHFKRYKFSFQLLCVSCTLMMCSNQNAGGCWLGFLMFQPASFPQNTYVCTQPHGPLQKISYSCIVVAILTYIVTCCGKMSTHIWSMHLSLPRQGRTHHCI